MNPESAPATLDTPPAAPPLLRVLLVDNDPDDLLRLRRLLGAIPQWRFALEEVASYADARTAMDRQAHDLYLIDWHLGTETAVDLLAQLGGQGTHAPRIVITGASTRTVDLQAMQTGASDYLEKEQLTASLLERSIRYALEQARFQLERDQFEVAQQRLIRQLQEALANVKTLRGLLPICAHCKKIRDDKGYWQQVEAYVRARTEAEFTHTICAACMQVHYPQEYASILADGVVP